MFHVKQVTLTNTSAVPLAGLTDRVQHQLNRYVQLLDQWRATINLISERSFAEVWERHVLDSLQLYRACHSAKRWLDLGSGAGFPGIVLAVCLAETTDAQVHCVEADSKKCAFLRAVAQDLKIPAKVHNIRAESLSLNLTGPIDVVTARAFSSIGNIMDLAQPFLASGALEALPRGRG